MLIHSGGNDSQEAPKIEFPCQYPIKILGRQSEDYQDVVLAVMHKHAPGFDESKVTTRPSGKGTFLAITVTITATGEEQISAIFEDLKATGKVKMVI